MDSFEDIYREYYPRLAAFASLFLKKEEAHDVVQDIFLSLLETHYQDKQSLKAYLYKAVKNKCVDHLRHQAIEHQYSSELGQKLLQKESEYFYASHNEIEAAFLSKELQEKINSVVEKLPFRGREVFKLFFFQQKTAKEISVLLEVSTSTIENHLYNCMKIVRLRLSKYLLVWIYFPFFY